MLALCGSVSVSGSSSRRLLEKACAQVNPETVQYYSEGQQVAMYALLKHISTQRYVLVCSTHISCAWQTPSKQIAQQQCILNMTKTLLATITAKLKIRNISFLLAGDFNAQPTSGLYRLVVDGTLDPAHPDALPNSPNGADVSQVRMPFPLAHTLSLRSAYGDKLGGEPACTNYKPDFKGTLDYIFYQPASVRVESVLALPSEAELALQSGIPDDRHPSDHVALVAQFAFV